MSMAGIHVAKPLYEEIGPEAFYKVAEWLRSVSGEHALETTKGVHSPTVSWLAECVTFYNPEKPQ